MRSRAVAVPAECGTRGAATPAAATAGRLLLAHMAVDSGLGEQGSGACTVMAYIGNGYVAMAYVVMAYINGLHR